MHSPASTMPLPPMAGIPPEASVSGEDGLPVLPRHMRAPLTIQLDGRKVYACVAYSIPGGFVRVLVGNGKGYLVQGDGEAATIATVRVTGRLTVDRAQVDGAEVAK